MVLRIEDFANRTINRVEQSIRSNECNLKQEEKIQKANESPNELDIAIERITELTVQMRSFNNYDGLRGLVIQHFEDLRQDIDEKLKEKAKILETFAPLLKLPLSPFAVVKFMKKLVLGDKLPQIQAAIKMALQIIKLLDALNQLQQEVRNSVRKLEDFVKSFPDFIVGEARNTLDRATLNLKFQIQGDIAAALCGELDEQDITIDTARNILTLIEEGKRGLQTINELTVTINNDLTSSLSSIEDIQTDICSATGQTPAIDTSSSAAFLQSVESGAADEFMSEAQTIALAVDSNAGVTNTREINAFVQPPILNSNIAFGVISNANGFILSDFSDWSVAKQLANPTANLVFTVTVNNVPKGNLTIDTTGGIHKNSGNVQIDLLPNDIINLVNPANANTAAANTRVYFTIRINETGTQNGN